MIKKLLTAFILFAFFQGNAQDNQKPLFTQPLYLDLPGDVVPEKGYREINLLQGHQAFPEYYYHRLTMEYAFAPVKNLGIEIELPMNFFSAKKNQQKPENRLEAVRIGAMYSLPKRWMPQTAIAVGFFNDFELNDFNHFDDPILEGNSLNPFVLLAKNWQKRWSLLLYTGPSLHHLYNEHLSQSEWKINTTLGYRFWRSGHSLAIELNQSIHHGRWEHFIRPQFQFRFSTQWSVGMGGSLPIGNEEGTGGFARLLFTPTKKN